jgi:hypothetical protein
MEQEYNEKKPFYLVNPKKLGVNPKGCIVEMGGVEFVYIVYYSLVHPKILGVSPKG